MATNINSTTKEVEKQVKTLKNGNPINTAAQFGKPGGNPRHNGAWKKEDTARYKLEQMLKLSEAELKAVAIDKEAPLFERKLANCIAKGNWKEIEGMMNQVYGQPRQLVETMELTPPQPLSPRKQKRQNL